MTQKSEYAKPLPRPNELSKPFWDGLKSGVLKLQRCGPCERFIFYPRTLCPYCMGQELEWIPVSGRGKVYTYTVVRRAMIPGFRDDTPYVFAIVELDEGPRVPTNIVNCAIEDVRVDMPVQATYDDVTAEITLLKFEPA